MSDDPSAASEQKPDSAEPPQPAPSASAPTADPEGSTAPEPAPEPGPEPRQPEGPPGKSYFWGTGRRKRSIARVRVRPGQGEFKINGREIGDYFHLDKDRQVIVTPLEATGSHKKVDVFVNIHGGGTTGQAGAIVLGIARALKACNPDYEPALRQGNFLSRDPRKVERKKYGQRGARRRFQFSKR